MTGAGRGTRSKLRFFFLALGGVLLFVCGIVYGVWLIIRYRRRAQDGS